jgi:hypothetical protein
MQLCFVSVHGPRETYFVDEPRINDGRCYRSVTHFFLTADAILQDNFTACDFPILCMCFEFVVEPGKVTNPEAKYEQLCDFRLSPR